VKKCIPELQEKIDHLKTFLPAQANQDDGAEDQSNAGAVDDDDDDFAATYNKVSKRKKIAPSEGHRPGKKVKQEPF
jgi:hypothetical protein